jgi:hypothetical protein
MVTKSNILRLVDRDLESVSDTLLDLEDVAEEWEDEPMHNRVIWATEWHEIMDRLLTVYEAHEAGLLRPDQEQYYQTVLAELKRQMSTVERLGLRKPRFPLGE